MDFAYIILLSLSALLLHDCFGQDAETVDSQSPSFQVKISPEGQTQQVQKGANRVLTCTVSATDGDQKPVLHWEVADNKITSTSTSDRIRIEFVSDGNLRLKINDMRAGDEGPYKCVATLGTQTDSRSVRLEIYEALKFVSPLEQFGIYQENGVVSCEATGTPKPSVTFKKADGSNIQSNEKFEVQANNLTIRNLTFEDAGQYFCDVNVYEIGDSQFVTINFEVVKVPLIEEELDVSPSLPKVGDDVKVICKAEGVPDATYQFKKGENVLPESQVDSTNGILTIPGVKLEDEGEYTCVATNKGGSAEKGTFVDVKVMPSISELPEKEEANEGDEKQIKCSAEGDPAPDVTWQKDGSYIDEVDEMGDGPQVTKGADGETSQTLTFASIKPEHAGDYTCTAVNNIGSATKTVSLEVKYKPHFNTNYRETNFYGWEGHTANLTCLASANEVATFQWFKTSGTDASEEPLQSDGSYILSPPQEWPQYHLSSRSLLVTVGADDSVYGQYRCEATNSLGSEQQTVELIQAVTPSEPVATITNVLSTMVTLKLDVPDEDGGQPILGYYYNYFPSNDTFASEAEEKYVAISPGTTQVDLRNLLAKTEYTIKVSAHNVVGRGPEFTSIFTTQEVSKPLQLNMTSPREGPEPFSYKIEWTDPDNGGAPITEYRIKYKKVTVDSEWQVESDVDKTFIEKSLFDPDARSFLLENLDRDSFYDVRITAVNKEGESAEEQKIIKTSGGSTKASSVGTAGLGSGPVIGIVIGLLILIVIIAVVIFLVFKRKPEIVGRLRGLGGKGGEEERGKSDDGKDPAEEEKLIKKDDTIKVENETEESKPEQTVEEQQEEFEPDSKPEAQPTAEAGTGEKSPELSTPATTTEIKITPETPEKPENPPA